MSNSANDEYKTEIDNDEKFDDDSSDESRYSEIKKSSDYKEYEKRERRKKELLKEVISNSIYILVVLIVTLLLVKYVGQRTVVIGSSMNPTLYDADNLIVDKISYRFEDPKRFDIVVFPYELEKNTFYIKRIIGLPGEKIRIDEAGNIYINGVILQEPIQFDVITKPGIAAEEITLGDDEYFVLGDNRNNSSDSRVPYIGPINRSEIIGKAWIVAYPFDHFGVIKHGN